MNPSLDSNPARTDETTRTPGRADSQDLVRLMVSTEPVARDRLVEVPRQLQPDPGAPASPATPVHPRAARAAVLRRMRALQRAMLAASALLTTVLLVPMLPVGQASDDERWVVALEQSASGNLRSAMETLYAYERSLPPSAAGRRALVFGTMAEHAAALGHATQATLLAAKAAMAVGLAPAEAAETLLPAQAAASTLDVDGGFETAAQRRADEVARLRVAALLRGLPATR